MIVWSSGLARKSSTHLPTSMQPRKGLSFVPPSLRSDLVRELTDRSDLRLQRDWSMEKVTFVVREERDRERDPILGIVEFKTLGEAFHERSEVVKWFPLVGGIGYGTM